MFDRAEARDFADMFEITRHSSKDDLLEQAAQADRGFDRPIFAQMLRSLDRFTDEDLPAPAAQIPALRSFFATWANELER